MNKTLPKPTLNISAYYVAQDNNLSGWDWTDPRTGLQPFSNHSNMAFRGTSNETFSVEYIKENGSCEEVGVGSPKDDSPFLECWASG